MSDGHLDAFVEPEGRSYNHEESESRQDGQAQWREKQRELSEVQADRQP